MTAPQLQLSVSRNTSEEARKLEEEIAALQVQINYRTTHRFAPPTIETKVLAKAQTRLADLQSRLLAIKDPTATASAKITPSPVHATELPVFGLPLLDVGRVGVSDLKLTSRRD